MDPILDLIQKHRGNGLLVDTNLLVLLLVGTVNPNRIAQFKRTSKYSIEDFATLQGIVMQFQRRFATPQIWAEVNNLTDLEGKELVSVREALRTQMQIVNEHYQPAAVLGEHPAYARLGLTDASICDLSQNPMLVVTDDIALHVWLTSHAVDSINFTYMRSFI